jgi:hypothetical protein
MSMMQRTHFLLCIALLLPHACSGPGSGQAEPLKYKAVGSAPETLALYEAWWGHPNHINIGYSSHDTTTVSSQIKMAKSMGISGFVVDWYGDREPFIDKSYAVMQQQAARNNFKVAMMYDETDLDDGATDLAIEDFTMFRDTYLSPKSPGHDAYLTYEGRPVFFIFPKGRHTDWNKVRQVLSQWNPAPILIQENLPNAADAGAFDGFYAWVQPGPKGWAADGSNWGEQYLSDFYQTMDQKFADKIVVGGAWATFNDSRASWGLNRHIDARCGQTFKDTFELWRKYVPASTPPPFILVETWNDYEEGTAVERGLPSCGNGQPAMNTTSAQQAEGNGAARGGRE